MRIHDIILGPFIALLGVGLCVWSLFLPMPSHLDYGPGMFPRLTGAGLILSGLVIAAGALTRGEWGALVGRPLWTRDLRIAWRFWVLLVAPFFYVFAADTLGFFATAALILIAVMLANGVRLHWAVPVGLVLAAFVNIVFASLLGVPLPWGPLTPISGYLIW